MQVVLDVGVAVEDQHRTFTSRVGRPVAGHPVRLNSLPPGLHWWLTLTAALVHPAGRQHRPRPVDAEDGQQPRWRGWRPGPPVQGARGRSRSGTRRSGRLWLARLGDLPAAVPKIMSPPPRCRRPSSDPDTAGRRRGSAHGPRSGVWARMRSMACSLVGDNGNREQPGPPPALVPRSAGPCLIASNGL